jgi:hypothetical protein
MEKLHDYQQWIEHLISLPASEADVVLKAALMRGTGDGGLTLMRAHNKEYYEEVHHYYGCQKDDPCDHHDLPEPLHWETHFLQFTDHAEDNALEYAEMIMGDWHDLVKVAHHFEARIRQCWIKMSVFRRKKLLLKIWPGMPLHHRPDIDDEVINACCHQRSANFFAYEHPYLNLEDLVLPNSMLLLFHARTQFPPSTFALSDYELARTLNLRPTLLEPTRSTMDVTDKYGCLVEWDTEEDASNSIKKGDTVHPRVGIQILRLHITLTAFLGLFVSEIIGDELRYVSTLSKLPKDEIKDLPSLPNSGDEYRTLGTIIREAPYRVPQHLDLGQLRRLVSARTNEAEDHIWLLREDPGYFAEIVFELREHQRGQSEDTKVHEDSLDEIMWARVLRNVAVDGYVELSIWRKVHEHLTQLEQLSQKHVEPLCPREDLPQEYFDMLVKTWFLLEAIQLDLIEELRAKFPSSLDASVHFLHERLRDKDDDSAMFKAVSKMSKDLHPDVQRTLTLFMYLWAPPKRRTLGTHAVVEALEHMLQNNSRAKDVTSAWVASCLSQLSIITECLRQLNSFQPWATKIKNTIKERRTELLLAYVSDLSKWHSILHTSFSDTGLVALGKPGIKFRYPINKRRSRTNVETLRAAEASLDAFWEAADNKFLRQAGRKPSELIESISSERTLQRTPPWKEPDHASRTVTSPQEAEYLYIPIPNSLHDPTKQITGVFDKLTIVANEKAKTQGTGPRETEIQEEAVTSDAVEDPQPTFQLDQRAHKVFQTLFHSPLSRNQPGETHWRDFLHAMALTGFSVQKLQGSAWQFTPQNLDVEQPIQFHEPHPTHKLPFTWARRYGRRLARTYGWRGDMFCLA